MRKQKIELLAPAKNLELGKEAINCGADALYIGAYSFSARKEASNSLTDIEKLCQYAHFYKAKVYLAVNTLFYDKEKEAIQKLLWDAYRIGIDAFIIQDMGILEMDLPPIPLFASTQTHNKDLKKIQFLEKVGFQRVILARELTLEEIQTIAKNTTIDLEFFVHGALCVSYSWQCYLSYAIGKRSGNRGECAQPCRNLYFFPHGEKGHFLSLKDLNLSSYLSNLLEAGITSFKIEGRLKEKDYVKNTTLFYRKALDNILENKKMAKNSSGKVFTSFQPDLNQTFHREYSTYFLFGRSKNLTYPQTPKFKGERIGIVIKKEKNYFILQPEKISYPLQNGDGISFFDKNNILCGTSLIKIEGNKIFPDKIEGIEENKPIYRNLSRFFLRELEKPILRKIGIKIFFQEEETGFRISIQTEDNETVSFFQECQKIKAEKEERAISFIIHQLSKIGNTSFYLQEPPIIKSKAYFFTPAFLNQIRRNALDLLENLLKTKYQREEVYFTPNSFPYPYENIDYQSNVINSLSEQFYRRHKVNKIEYGVEKTNQIENKILMTTRFCLRYERNCCPKEKPEEKAEPFFLHDEKGRRLRLEFDCKNCQMLVFLEKK